MKRRIVFVIGPAFGHLGRAIKLAQTLTLDSSIEVTLIQPSTVNSQGETKIDDIAIRRISVGERNAGRLIFVDALEGEFDRGRFDLVVQDMDPFWTATARYPDVPKVYLTNIFLTRHAGLDTIQADRHKVTDRTVSEARDRKSLPPIEDGRDYYEWDRVVCLDPPCITEMFPPPPPHYRTPGAIYWTRDGRPPESLAEAANLLFLSLGTTGGPKLTSEHVAALRSLTKAQTVVSCCRKLDLEAQRALGVDYAFNWLEALGPVLERSCAALTHAGAGSTYQALAHGVPVFCAPGHRNHLVLSKLIEDAGVGLCVADKTVEELLTADFGALRENARRAAARMDMEAALTSAANEIRDLAA